ncbi:unnamed protein product [Caenorhabditis sp. 36 PRJEB53466]|nr:unnamed protein product [Caenorhabditis sp. 36 PRJEB53466]
MADPGDKDGEMGSEPNGCSKEAAAIIQLLAECGVNEFDPRVVSMLMDVQYTVTQKVLQMASGLSRHASKQQIDSDDVQTAADVLGVLSTRAPDRERMLQLANDKNQQPLPSIRHNYGLKLPNDRFCQLQQNVTYKTDGEYQQAETQQQQQQQQQQSSAPRPGHIIEPPTAVWRADQVQQSILKRHAPDDDFDS